MKITQIQIRNFKSIEDLTINLESFGQGENDSSTSIYVGVNESGKSNILEAMNALNHGFRQFDFTSTLFKHYKDDRPNFINVYYYVDLASINVFELISSLPIENKSAFEKIILKEVVFDVFLGMGNNYEMLHLSLDKIDIDWHHFYVVDDEIFEFPILENEETVFTKEEALSLLELGEELLTKDKFERFLADELFPLVKLNLPEIIYWKSSPEHLINESVDLLDFDRNNDLSIPLKHIFSIFGAKTREQISQHIMRAIENDEYKLELEDELSEVVTNHVNSIWKDHKIAFRIKIEGNSCKVHVEDISTKRKYYKMNNRSDGFKQFVSLMLSLSAQNKAEQLKDTIILLDEPEVHLHPSGIRYMRDEILRLGKNNHVFVSTHSHYFVDTETPERHFIVERNQKTIIKQLDNSANFSDDEVTSKAFGISLYKELLPQHIFLVEGHGDKLIFNSVFRYYMERSKFTVKGVGGCSKIHPVASLLASEGIDTIILLDSDSEGEAAKTNVIKTLKPFFSKNNVFTLKEILPELCNGATLEDLFPQDFIIGFFSKKYSKEFTFKTDVPIIVQLIATESTLKGKKDKQPLEDLKTELSNLFLKEFDSKEKIESGAERFHRFCLSLTSKIDSLKPLE